MRCDGVVAYRSGFVMQRGVTVKFGNVKAMFGDVW